MMNKISTTVWRVLLLAVVVVALNDIAAKAGVDPHPALAGFFVVLLAFVVADAASAVVESVVDSHGLLPGVSVACFATIPVALMMNTEAAEATGVNVRLALALTALVWSGVLVHASVDVFEKYRGVTAGVE